LIAGNDEGIQERLVTYLKSLRSTKDYSFEIPNLKKDQNTPVIQNLSLNPEDHKDLMKAIARTMEMNIREIKNQFSMLIDCQQKANGEHYFLIQLN